METKGCCCWGVGETFYLGDECGRFIIRGDVWEIVNQAGRQTGTNTRAQIKRLRSSPAGPLPRCRADPGGNPLSRLLNVIVSSLHEPRLRNVHVAGVHVPGDMRRCGANRLQLCPTLDKRPRPSWLFSQMKDSALHKERRKRRGCAGAPCQERP